MAAKDETVLARTPTPGKKGQRVNKEKYDRVFDAILKVLKERDEIEFKKLPAQVKKHLKGKFDGSIGWYTTTVKLDMEVRDIIQRVPKSSPQRLRLKR